MTIHFAAVHERNSWRKHAKHETIEAATVGPDGAERLLLRDGRVGAMWAKYGVVHAVFVWVDGAHEAVAFRLCAAAMNGLQRVSIPVEFLVGFKRGRGPSLQEIENWFSGETPQPPLKSRARLAAMPFRYGDKPTWRIVLDAVKELARPVSAAEVGDFISSRIPDFARANLSPDLSVLSVNCPSRGHHSVNRLPRRTDTGNVYDALVRLEDREGRGVRYQPYEPRVHGIWELVDLGGRALMPRFIQSADANEMEAARAAAIEAGVFEFDVDARRHVIGLIVQREGQPAFRNALLKAYERQCAISGCRVEALLEAAHIVPYQGAHTNAPGNGLLLRSDLHKLFDLHLLHIDAYRRIVRISPELYRTEYEFLDGATMRLPLDLQHAPSIQALLHHAERCGWLHTSVEAR